MNKIKNKFLEITLIYRAENATRSNIKLIVVYIFPLYENLPCKLLTWFDARKQYFRTTTTIKLKHHELKLFSLYFYSISIKHFSTIGICSFLYSVWFHTSSFIYLVLLSRLQFFCFFFGSHWQHNKCTPKCYFPPIKKIFCYVRL